MRVLFCSGVAVGILLSASLAGAADPVVENVQLAQRLDGSGILDITFDLSDADADTCAVALQLSIDDGMTWDYPALNLSGAVGDTVVPGPDKVISCDLGVLPVTTLASAVRARVLASDTRVMFGSHSPDHMAVINLAAVDWSDPQNFDKFSRTDLLIITGSDLWNGATHAGLPIVQELKARNEDLVIVGYVSGFSAKLYAADPNSSAYWHDWFVRTRPYWAWTTEGDTAQTWPDNVVINITEPGCRAAMIETIIEYQTTSFNQLDGVYWDYFNHGLWSYPGLDMQGEIDLDGDGIAHLADPDELLAYQAAQVDLVQALRDSLGEDYIQIFNGQRAYSDQAFASLADGVMYELFPKLFFPSPDMTNALDPDYAYNLMTVRSWLRPSEHGPFLIMSNTGRNFYRDHEDVITQLRTGNQFRVIATLIDGFACWNSHDASTFSYTYGWPEQDINLGPPLGPATFTDNFIRRDFQFGKVELEMDLGYWPNPFNYRIWCLGQLVEELAVPYHYP